MVDMQCAVNAKLHEGLAILSHTTDIFLLLTNSEIHAVQEQRTTDFRSSAMVTFVVVKDPQY